MKKTIITRKVAVNASKKKVWEALADFGNVQSLSPNVAKSYLTSDQQSGVGATRHCDFASMGAQVEERIVAWEEGESMKIDIYQSKNMPMITGMEAEFKISEEGESTVITGTFEYGMTNIIGNFLNSITMRKMNEKAWVQFLAGIKHNVETGEKVNKDTSLDLAPIQEI
jgi:carbon monoxide dehydrogenase subunit G